MIQSSHSVCVHKVVTEKHWKKVEVSITGFQVTVLHLNWLDFLTCSIQVKNANGKCIYCLFILDLYIILFCPQEQNYFTKTTWVKIISPLILTVSVICSSVQRVSHAHLLSNPRSLLFGESLDLQFNQQIFVGFQLRALCRPADNVYFGFLKVVLHHEQSVFWVIVMSEVKVI